MKLVEAEGLCKSYRTGDMEVPAIRGIDFAIEAGALVAFVCPSGSGKSTLLNLIGCLDKPDGGRLTVLDAEVAALDRRAAAEATSPRPPASASTASSPNARLRPCRDWPGASCRGGVAGGLVEPGKLLIPELLARDMKVKVGDTVVLVATNLDGSVNGMTFEVQGVLSTVTPTSIF